MSEAPRYATTRWRAAGALLGAAFVGAVLYPAVWMIGFGIHAVSILVDYGAFLQALLTVAAVVFGLEVLLGAPIWWTLNWKRTRGVWTACLLGAGLPAGLFSALLLAYRSYLDFNLTDAFGILRTYLAIAFWGALIGAVAWRLAYRRTPEPIVQTFS